MYKLKELMLRSTVEYSETYFDFKETNLGQQLLFVNLVFTFSVIEINLPINVIMS